DALARFISSHAIQLKWPNDIYLRGRKTGGILSESVPGWQDRLIVGIGVNVNNRIQHEGDSEQLSRIAASLIEFDGLERDLTNVLIAILDEFDRRWAEFLENGFDAVAAAYRQRCLLTGKTVTIQQREGESISGHCRGIDHYG